MQKRTVKILQYSITFLVCAILTFAYIAANGIFQPQTVDRYMTILSNGFLTIGVVCLSVGLLVCLSNNGAYDFLIYGFKRFFSLFKKDPTKVKYHTFYDYHIAKQEEEDRSFWFLVIDGAIFIIISIIFIAIWYNVKPAS